MSPGRGAEFGLKALGALTNLVALAIGGLAFVSGRADLPLVVAAGFCVASSLILRHLWRATMLSHQAERNSLAAQPLFDESRAVAFTRDLGIDIEFDDDFAPALEPLPVSVVSPELMARPMVPALSGAQLRDVRMTREELGQRRRPPRRMPRTGTVGGHVELRVELTPSVSAAG